MCKTSKEFILQVHRAVFLRVSSRHAYLPSWKADAVIKLREAGAMTHATHTQREIGRQVSNAKVAPPSVDLTACGRIAQEGRAGGKAKEQNPIRLLTQAKSPWVVRKSPALPPFRYIELDTEYLIHSPLPLGPLRCLVCPTEQSARTQVTRCNLFQSKADVLLAAGARFEL